MQRSNSCSVNYFNSTKKNAYKQNNQVFSFSNLSEKEFINHPGVKELIKRKRHTTLEFLTKELPPMVPTQDIADEKTSDFLGNLNAFRLHYHNYFKEEEKESRNYNKVSKENAGFAKRYRIVFKNSNSKLKGQVENSHLSGIKAEYEKRNYKIPQLSLEHNIFKEHPLLVSDAELYKYYLFQRGNPSTESNSLKYLNKLNDDIFAFSKENNDNKNKYNSHKRKDNLERLKAFNLLLQDIKKNKIDILNTKNTLKSMENDEFFLTKSNFNINIKTERARPTQTSQLEDMILIDNATSNQKNKKERDNSAQCSNHICSTRLSSAGRSVISRSNSHKFKKPLDLLQINEREDNKTASSYNKNMLESLYDEVKETDLANLPVFEIQNYFVNKKCFDVNDNSTKGIFNQIQFIKEKMINKEYLNDHYRLKGFRISEDIPNSNIEMLNENKKIEKCLLEKEKMLVRVSYQNLR